ncbi:AMP-binding protein, partial [Nocardia brasiliensis]|uniref:AMP-binding protein n=2 Tax=Nocardia brasiliensis TaxID=37326 RepID=UPI00245861A5
MGTHAEHGGADRLQPLAEDWNNATTPTTEHTLPELFTTQAATTPDAVAVVAEGVELTYGELDARANQVAWWLIDQGVGVEDRVAVLLPRSVELVVVLLGIVRAGGVYVPIDPDYPAERVAFIRADARPVLVVDAAPDIASYPVTDPGVRVVSSNAAYVIYTSGSTGVPKGV